MAIAIDSATRTNKPIHFRDDEIWESMNSLGDSPGGTARVNLKRYLYLVSRNIAAVNRIFTIAEICLICEALPYNSRTGVDLSPSHITALWLAVEEAVLLHQLDKKWNVDLSELIFKLRQLDDCQFFSLVFAVEKFWTLRGRTSNADKDWTKQLNQVGLVGLEKINAASY
ncbi:MAG: hypothetical protein WBB28_05120 [Crinalium sp.]